ncbi:TonB-dependent receptor plug domain-containing protein [Labilibaculum sp. 44]|uniref:TonB-dependent receptor plug domain-containing protein n=2 Tax=Labilibaculum euxinus TaxID=2686357 RepID=A0A7M4DB68_9BACT|nr:TonB-dependent receptor plug domain-containing protein [Labilibaculum euxinus]MVB09102.1 TonB-dependent receptor plug domain-containing protein [Labilibaculum euxinus]
MSITNQIYRKMKKLNVYGLLILFLFIFSSSYGQKKTFTGTIFVFDSIPVMNAEILISSSKQIVKSDSEGNFSFEGILNEKIKISADGFVNESQKLTGDSNFYKVNLNLKNSKKSQKLAIDSGHIKDSDQFSTLILYFKNNTDYSHYTDALQIIKDKYPGVRIEDNGVIIRGRQSINGPINAIIEIDGIIVDFDALTSLPTATIKNIKILTPSSSGMYGSRGGNGVVVVKTKQGVRK